MSYRVNIAITCKEGTLNPEDKVISAAMTQLGYNHESIKKGLFFSYESSKETESETRTEASEIFENVLTKIGLASFNTQSFKIISISKLEEKVN